MELQEEKQVARQTLRGVEPIRTPAFRAVSSKGLPKKGVIVW